MSTLDSPQMSDVTTVSARSIGVRYGLIASLILVAIGLIFYVGNLVDYSNQNSATNWISNLINWAVIAGGMVMAMKQYREASGGYMTFGKAFGVGFWVTLVITLVMAVWTYLFFAFIAPDLMDTIMEASRDRMSQQGQSEEQIDQAMGMMKWMMNPGAFALFGLVGMLITGIIIDLIVSAIMQKKPPMETMA